MAEIYKFFNSAPGDERWHYASDFADYFGNVLSNGILHTDNNGDLGLRVSVVTGTLTTKVTPGKAIIKGYAYENTTDLILTHDIPETTLKRIDRIVLRLDLNNSNRYVKLFVKKGVSAENPVAPELQRDNYIHELSLAQVLVRENTTQLLECELKDERMYEDLCGLVSSIISVPTTQFQEEWDTWFTSVQEEGFAPYSDTGYKEDLKTIDKSSIVAGVNELKEDYVRSPGYATATGTNTYAVTLNPSPSSYKEGMGLVIKVANASTGAASINVNGLGTVPILKSNKLPVSDFKAGSVYSLRYTGSAFMLQGEGGDSQQTFNNMLTLLSKTTDHAVSYVDDTYYYVVLNQSSANGIAALKYMKSNMSLVATIRRKFYDSGGNYQVVAYSPGLVTEISTTAPVQNNYAYNESGTIIKTWNPGYYARVCHAVDDGYFAIEFSNPYKLSKYNWNMTLLRTFGFSITDYYYAGCSLMLTNRNTGVLVTYSTDWYRMQAVYLQDVNNYLYTLYGTLAPSKTIASAFAIAIGG